ncbi:MAG: hypothetical protein ACXVXL_13175 [Solirubrobacteraceae bacterium]
MIPVPAVPIPSVLLPPAPAAYIGAPASAHPIRGVPRTPQNPHMAPNGASEIHNDGWQTNAFTWGGPLGRSPQTMSTMIIKDCGSITFDSQGRVVSVCVGASGPQLYMFDPNTLATLATFSLPPRQSVPSNQDYTGGGYFYLDNHDQVVTATTTHHIYVIAETPGATPGFALQRDYDLSKVLTSSEGITSALPDQNGLLWVVTKTDGVVLTLNLRTGAIHSMKLGNGATSEIENSFATDQHGGVYIATNRKLYRFAAGENGTPKISWQVTYLNSGEHKIGQVDDGTGTTPLVMPGGYVSITDNADPMDIVVYRTARRIKGPRRVCRVPVFTKGSSATENSLIGAGRAMIVENNYGYQDPTDVSEGKLSAPGFTRVDLNRNGKGCHVVWTNRTERARSVVPNVSLANGLIYTYTKDPGMSDPWYWTTLDFRTGRTVYKQFAGSSPASFYNNNYAGIALSRKGTEYLGTLGGLIAMRDS